MNIHKRIEQIKSSGRAESTEELFELHKEAMAEEREKQGIGREVYEYKEEATAEGFIITAKINGRKVECVFENGSGTPVDKVLIDGTEIREAFIKKYFPKIFSKQKKDRNIA